MEEPRALAERVRRLKAVAATMREGAIHTELIPEIDKILALPDRLAQRSATALQAIGRLSPLPVLVVHGLADGIIPPHHAQALYDAARRPKALWLIPGAAHIAAFRTKTNQDRLIEYLRSLGCAAQ